MTSCAAADQNVKNGPLGQAVLIASTACDLSPMATRATHAITKKSLATGPRSTLMVAKITKSEKSAPEKGLNTAKVFCKLPLRRPNPWMFGGGKTSNLDVIASVACYLADNKKKEKTEGRSDSLAAGRNPLDVKSNIPPAPEVSLEEWKQSRANPSKSLKGEPNTGPVFCSAVCKRAVPDESWKDNVDEAAIRSPKRSKDSVAPESGNRLACAQELTRLRMSQADFGELPVPAMTLANFRSREMTANLMDRVNASEAESVPDVKETQTVVEDHRQRIEKMETDMKLFQDWMRQGVVNSTSDTPPVFVQHGGSTTIAQYHGIPTGVSIPLQSEVRISSSPVQRLDSDAVFVANFGVPVPVRAGAVVLRPRPGPSAEVRPSSPSCSDQTSPSFTARRSKSPKLVTYVAPMRPSSSAQQSANASSSQTSVAKKERRNPSKRRRDNWTPRENEAFLRLVLNNVGMEEMDLRRMLARYFSPRRTHEQCANHLRILRAQKKVPPAIGEAVSYRVHRGSSRKGSDNRATA